MRKLINQIFYIVGIAFFIASCDSVDFGDKNVDPNNPSTPSTALLLTESETNIVALLTDTRPNLYVQYLSNGQYTEESRYASVNFSYNFYYNGPLINLNEIIKLNTDEETLTAAQANGSNANQIAVARLIKAFIFQQLTDRWGMIPYSEALQGLDNIFPKFDTQEDVYRDLFKEIDEAIAQFDGGKAPTGDIIFNGNADRWKQFGHTLKMNMALRLSNRFPDATGFAATHFKDSYQYVISSNAENMYYTFLSDENNDNPWEDRFETRKDYLLADTFVNMLIGTGTDTDPEDPRLALYSTVSEATGTYVGAPYGATNSDTEYYSFITPNVIYNKTAPAYFFTYSQMLFNQAEAVELGWISGDAENLFRSAIKASMDQWGVNPALGDDYVATRSYNGVESIAQEKYRSLFLQGYEGWSEWRRHGMNAIPLIAPATAINGGGKIPNRQGYGTTEKTQNGDNYSAAVAAQGADNLQTKVWWAN